MLPSLTIPSTPANAKVCPPVKRSFLDLNPPPHRMTSVELPRTTLRNDFKLKFYFDSTASSLSTPKEICSVCSLQ